MKKFSDTLEQDRDFEFLGELFQYKLVHWTVITDILDAPANGDSAKSGIQSVIDVIPEFIEGDEGQEKMRKLLAGEDKPAPIGQVNALYEWLLGVSSGRPTEAPSPSQPGPGRTARTSKGA